MEPIYIGSDHAGFQLKEALKLFLADSGHIVEDLGNLEYDSKDDYPDFALKVALNSRKQGKGVLICGSGQGMCIAANKVKGIRAVLVRDVHEAGMTRLHNDSNVICLSGYKLSAEDAKCILGVWLNTEFSGEERHSRRIEKIRRIENGM